MRPAPTFTPSPTEALETGRADALRARFFERVRASLDAHREYLTVRADDGDWQPAGPGAVRRTLRGDALLRTEIVRLAAGAALPWPDDARAQEILQLGAEPVYGVRERDAEPEPWVATTGTTVYVRHRLGDAAALAPLEARWWELPGPPSGRLDVARRRWHASSPGVQVLPLRGDRDVVSMLVRFEAGASVPDHRHELDEDCLVLEGEMFLGDILLRAGDYQRAPAGGSHFGEMSDVGVLFFFHGALDPVLRGETAAPR